MDILAVFEFWPFLLHTCFVLFVNSRTSSPKATVCDQPRILMAMARDGLLPPFFSTVHPKTSVPVNGTILAGAVAAIMAFMMNVDELSGMVRNIFI